MSVSPRTLSVLGLFALLPVAAYAALEASVVALSVACVLLIVGSLYTMFGPATGDGPHPSR